MARLAQEHIDIDNAALGPSTAVTAHQIGFHFMSSDKYMYMDDYLTEQEIKLICGLYRCWTGMYTILDLFSSNQTNRKWDARSPTFVVAPSAGLVY